MPLHGVALVDKPAGMSSFSVVSRLRRIFRPLGVTKAGHTGTLDPLATGLLPICIGEATKFAQRLLDSDKGYQAVVQFGVSTTTGDAEGSTLEQSSHRVTREALESVLPAFLGPIEQTPPAFSALKINGRPAYELARAGQAVTLARRTVCIYSMELMHFDEASQCAGISVRCSKGTYIRSLAVDIARAADTVGHLASLRRTLTGGFSLQDACTLDDWMSADEARLVQWLRPTDQLLGDLPRIELNPHQATDLRNGKVVQLGDPLGATSAGLQRAYADGSDFIGLVHVDAQQRLRAERLLSTQSGATPEK
ncbi:MAG: tRNA pseudouridine(55) synthase TruB [Burkholderiales bacterium]|nr:tRNA pseudouridine(55) synthase TruB [Burkholderiales bacterium]